MIASHQSEIARRYVAGQSTNDIARELNIRPSDVIGYVRRSKLQPPAMGVRYVPAEGGCDAGPAAASPPAETEQPQPIRPAAPAAPPPAGTQLRRVRAVERARLSGDAVKVSEVASPVSRSDEDLDDDEPVRRRGCPPGWLVSEDEYDAAFRRSGGRFEDVVFKQRRC